MMMYPVTFREFLGATGENQSLEILNCDEIPAFAHPHLMRQFKKYLIIGGMPQVVEQYARNNKGVLAQIKLVCWHHIDFITVDENFICLINC